MKKCIVCEKDLPPIDEKMPKNIEGGTMDIDFGYGSGHDTGNGCSGRSFYFSAAICDQCFGNKKHLGQWVSVERTWQRFSVLEKEIYRGP